MANLHKSRYCTVPVPDLLPVCNHGVNPVIIQSRLAIPVLEEIVDSCMAVHALELIGVVAKEGEIHVPHRGENRRRGIVSAGIKDSRAGCKGTKIASSEDIVATLDFGQ